MPKLDACPATRLHFLAQLPVICDLFRRLLQLRPQPLLMRSLQLLPAAATPCTRLGVWQECPWMMRLLSAGVQAGMQLGLWAAPLAAMPGCKGAGSTTAAT